MEILIDDSGDITGWQIDPVSIASFILVLFNTDLTRKALVEAYRAKKDTLANSDLLSGIVHRLGLDNQEEE